MITDLNQIRLLGKKKQDHNFRFRTFLKMKDDDNIDIIVHKLNMEYAAKIDCSQCGNSCSELHVLVDNEDIQELSKFIGISENDFKKTYTEKDDEGELQLKDSPCSFLKDKKCSVYDVRPKECIEFPNLHKEDFSSRLFDVIQNYSLCPIVFNVYEDLKVKLNFRG